MNWSEIVVFILSVGLAVYAIMDIYGQNKRGTLRQYLTGMLVGAAFGVGAVFSLDWSWVIALALGLGSVVLAPTVASAWRHIVRSRSQGGGDVPRE